MTLVNDIIVDNATHQEKPDDSCMQQEDGEASARELSTDGPPMIPHQSTTIIISTTPKSNGMLLSSSEDPLGVLHQDADGSEKRDSALSNSRQENCCESERQPTQSYMVTGPTLECRENGFTDKVGHISSSLAEMSFPGSGDDEDEDEDEVLARAMTIALNNPEDNKRVRQGWFPTFTQVHVIELEDFRRPKNGGQQEEESSEGRENSAEVSSNPRSDIKYTELGGNRCRHSFEFHVKDFARHVSKPGREFSSAICQVGRQRVQGSVCFLSAGYIQVWFTMYKTDGLYRRHCSDSDGEALHQSGRHRLRRAVSDENGRRTSKAIVKAVLLDPEDKLSEVSVGEGLEVMWDQEVRRPFPTRLGRLPYDKINMAAWANTISVRFIIEMATN